MSNLALLTKPIPTTLTLSHTRMHDLSRDPSSKTTTKEHEERILFQYSVQPASSPNFLVTGPTTASFAALEHETCTFSMQLIPLRTGRLELPDVRVWLAEYPSHDIDVEHAVGMPDSESALASPASAIARSPTFGGPGTFGGTSAGFVTTPPIQTSSRDSTSHSSAISTFPGAFAAQDIAAQTRNSLGSPTAMGLASSPAVSEPPPTPSTAALPGGMDEEGAPIGKTCRTEMSSKSYVEVVTGRENVTIGLELSAAEDHGLEESTVDRHRGHIRRAAGVEMIDVRHWA